MIALARKVCAGQMYNLDVNAVVDMSSI